MSHFIFPTFLALSWNFNMEPEASVCEIFSELTWLCHPGQVFLLFNFYVYLRMP